MRDATIQQLETAATLTRRLLEDCPPDSMAATALTEILDDIRRLHTEALDARWSRLSQIKDGADALVALTCDALDRPAHLR